MAQQTNENYDIKEPGTYTIIHKEGLSEQQPQDLITGGNIDSISRFLDKRYMVSVFPEKSHIVVDREEKRLVLRFNERDPLYYGEIYGKLEYNTDFTLFKINSGEKWGHQSFAQFIKLNRHFFDSDELRKLHKSLMEFKIKVNKELENSDNNRGDYRRIAVQNVVNRDIPESFNLTINVFTGVEPTTLNVEIYIDPDSFEVALISSELKEYEKRIADEQIDKELKAIHKIAQDIPIMEQ